jgi:ABC-type transporter Mla maintaining outer membrane lipid asymmetry ATPase subunit MlaF
MIYWSMTDDMTRRLTGTATPTWRDPPRRSLRASPVGRIERLMAGRTVVMVAHRMRTVQRADRVAFLDGGRVVEEGDHEELVRRVGRYADFFHVGAVSSR